MFARTSLIGLAAVCLVLFFAVGCEQKTDISPRVTIPASNGSLAGSTDGLPDLSKLPIDEDYGTPERPVDAASSPPNWPVSGTVGGPVAGQRVHTMQKGETIFRLGERYYGRASNANVQKIMSANPRYADPTKIPVGAQIVIPD